MWTVSLSDEALADIDASIGWYLEKQAFSIADDFVGELEQVLGLLARYPEMGAAVRHGARAFTLPRFPFSLIYRIHSKDVRVIAVAHHSRRPSYWFPRR